MKKGTVNSMDDKELFGNSEQLDCSDCVNHGGDWDCDHVHCRKGTDTISRQAVDGIAVKAEDGTAAKWREFFRNMPRISFTNYVPGEKQNMIVRWDDEG